MMEGPEDHNTRVELKNFIYQRQNGNPLRIPQDEERPIHVAATPPRPSYPREAERTAAA
jgi:hypothetical protein